MRILNDDVLLNCVHKTGKVRNKPSQEWVRIARKPVLVKPDPVGCTIGGCSNTVVPAGIKPCTKTVTMQAGESLFVRIDARPVCLDTVTGLTNGSPEGTVLYNVTSPGQQFVSAAL